MSKRGAGLSLSAFMQHLSATTLRDAGPTAHSLAETLSGGAGTRAQPLSNAMSTLSAYA